MKIAITGGAGFIGKSLTKAYLNAGHDVLIIDSLAYKTQQEIDARACLYRVDIRDNILSTILQHEQPDIVSHHVSQPCSIVPSEQLVTDADIHIRGLLNVLESCVNASVKKFIFASGGNSLYGRTENLPVTEDVALNPQNAYDISKVAGEWYVRYYTRYHGLQHTILRYANVYGASTSTHEHLSHALHYFVNMFAQQRSPIIRGTGEQVRDQIFIDDVVRANLQALNLGNNQTFNISSGQGHSFNQLFRLTASLLKSSIKPTYLSGSLEEEYSIILDNTQAQRLLKWRPEISLTAGIQRLIEHTCFEELPTANSANPQMRETEPEKRILSEV